MQADAVSTTVTQQKSPCVPPRAFLSERRTQNLILNRFQAGNYKNSTIGPFYNPLSELLQEEIYQGLIIGAVHQLPPTPSNENSIHIRTADSRYRNRDITHILHSLSNLN